MSIRDEEGIDGMSGQHRGREREVGVDRERGKGTRMRGDRLNVNRGIFHF